MIEGLSPQLSTWRRLSGWLANGARSTYSANKATANGVNLLQSAHTFLLHNILT